MYSRESTERPSDVMKRDKKEKKKPKPTLAKVFDNKNTFKKSKAKKQKKNKRKY